MANTYLKCIQHIYSPVRNNMLIVRGIENIQAHFRLYSCKEKYIVLI